LECMHKKDHHKVHFSAKKQVWLMQTEDSRLKRKEWALSPEGQKILSEASKSQWPKRKPVDRVCVICQKSFQTKNLNGTKYCSQVCRSKSQTLRESIEKPCIICKKIFMTRNLKPITKTCSQKCKGYLISLTKMEIFNDPLSSA
jgi:hypothetical protein